MHSSTYLLYASGYLILEANISTWHTDTYTYTLYDVCITLLLYEYIVYNRIIFIHCYDDDDNDADYKNDYDDINKLCL